MRHEELKPDKHRRHKATEENVAAQIVDKREEITLRLKIHKDLMPVIARVLTQIHVFDKSSRALSTAERTDLTNALALYEAVVKSEYILDNFVFEEDTGILRLPEIDLLPKAHDKEATLDVILGQLDKFWETFSRLREDVKALRGQVKPKMSS